MCKTPPFFTLFYILLWKTCILDITVFLQTWQCSDPSGSLAKLCCVPHSLVRTAVCAVCLCVSRSPSTEEHFFFILPFSEMPPLVFVPTPNCSVRGGFQRLPAWGSLLPFTPMSMVSLSLLQKEQTYVVLSVSKEPCLNIFAISQHPSAIQGSGGHFHFPHARVLAQLI